ncbi:MAG: CDP-alcohol phosphatidyltransferase family protein [Clostridia bacterium]|nr:CDP-alcohol phosphatidyltransferase family protein [Clostridia bacterium]
MNQQNPKIDWRAKLSKDQILTIPNLLSFFRIALIPIIAWLYCTEHPYWALSVVILSGLTDLADGYIARKYNMITDFGKMIDTIADKLTQGVVLICLLTHFPWMWLPLGIMILKESFSLSLRLIVFKKTELVTSAVWHGKLCTCLLYFIMALHIVWPTIPSLPSLISIFVVSAVMIYSFIRYTIDGINIIRQPEKYQK